MTTFMSTYDRVKFELDLLREIAQVKLTTYRTAASSAMQFGDQSLQHRMQQRYRLWAEELRLLDAMGV